MCIRDSGCGESRFVRPTQRAWVSRCAARAIVSEVESAVFNALLSQLATATENLGADSAPNDDLAVRFTDDRGGAERVHDPDGLVVSITERPIVIVSKRNQERSGLTGHPNVDERSSDRAFSRTRSSSRQNRRLMDFYLAPELYRVL